MDKHKNKIEPLNIEDAERTIIENPDGREEVSYLGHHTSVSVIGDFEDN